MAKLFGKFKVKHEQKVGKVLKCPFCGEIISNLDFKCPACGNEINGQKVNSNLEVFIKNINKYESRSAVHNKFSSYFKSAHKLTLSSIDKKEASYIESYIVNNDRAELYEFLIFISNKLQSLNGSNKPLLPWSKVWKNKAEEIKKKSDLLIPNDKNIKEYYENAVSYYKKARNKGLLKLLGFILVYFLLAAFVITMIVLGSFGYLG